MQPLPQGVRRTDDDLNAECLFELGADDVVSRNVATQADPPSPSATAEPEAMQVWDAAELRHAEGPDVTH